MSLFHAALSSRRRPAAAPTYDREEHLQRQLQRMTRRELLAIVRNAPDRSADQSLRERLAWREIAIRGAHTRPSN